MPNITSLRYLNFAISFLLLFLVVYILYIGKSLLLPFTIALVFWYIIINLAGLYRKIPFGKTRTLPRGLALLLAIITAGAVLYVFFLLLSHSIQSIISSAPTYQKKLQQLTAHVTKLFGNKTNFHDLIANVNLSTLFSRLAVIASLTASNFVLIVVYLLFLLLEHHTFTPKLQAMCKNSKNYQRISTLMAKIDNDINNYLKIKTGINLLAGVGSYVCLLIFKIHYAEFWGSLVFLLHYIPFVGPIIAVILILLAASVQIVHLVPFLLFTSILILVQFGVGNFLEPKWMGNRLNLSPIVILLSLAFWGAVWGIMGMFLCVPLMVIITIILAKFQSTHSIAVMLSATGKIEDADSS